MRHEGSRPRDLQTETINGISFTVEDYWIPAGRYEGDKIQNMLSGVLSPKDSHSRRTFRYLAREELSRDHNVASGKMKIFTFPPGTTYTQIMSVLHAKNLVPGGGLHLAILMKHHSELFELPPSPERMVPFMAPAATSEYEEVLTVLQAPEARHVNLGKGNIRDPMQRPVRVIAYDPHATSREAQQASLPALPDKPRALSGQSVQLEGGGTATIMFRTPTENRTYGTLNQWREAIAKLGPNPGLSAEEIDREYHYSFKMGGGDVLSMMCSKPMTAADVREVLHELEVQPASTSELLAMILNAGIDSIPNTPIVIVDARAITKGKTIALVDDEKGEGLQIREFPADTVWPARTLFLVTALRGRN